MKNNEMFMKSFYTDSTQAITALESSISECSLDADEKAALIESIYNKVTSTASMKQSLAQDISNQFWQAKEMFGWNADTTMAQAQLDLYASQPEVIENNPL